MKYKSVIFDFDGTLADTFPWTTKVIDALAEKFQFPKIPKSDHGLLRNYDVKKLLKHLGLPIWKVPIIGNHVRKLMAEDIDTIPLFEGIASLLQALARKHIQMAIVSSNSKENITGVLGKELIALIQHFECGVSIFGKNLKLRKVISKIGIPERNTIYIGDEIRDIDAANNVGISSGAVAWGYNTTEALKEHNPTEFFCSVDELAETLLA